MRRFYYLLLTCVLLLGVSPSVSFALSNEDLASFLESEGLTEEQLSAHLSDYYWGLTPEDFETIAELDEFLGEKISDENLQQLLEDNNFLNEEELMSLLIKNQKLEEGQDLQTTFLYVDALESTIYSLPIIPKTDENLQELVDTYGLTLEELNQIFVSNNDTLEDYEFIEDIETMLLQYGVPITEQTLNIMLENYGLTLEQLNSILIDQNDSLEQYSKIDDLEIKLLEYGVPVTDKNLQDLIEVFELTFEELSALLLQYEDSLESYQTIDELYFSVAMYMSIEESDEFLEELGIGLDKNELKNIVKHFLSIDMTDPAFIEKMSELENRLLELGDLESPSDLTEEQKTILVSSFQEMMNLYQLQAKYFLIKGTERITVSDQEMLTMITTNGYDLGIELYNLDGMLLADITVPAEFLGGVEPNEQPNDDENENQEEPNEEETEVVNENVNNTDNIKSEVQVQASQTSSQQVQTAGGERLPDTAGNNGNGIIFGFGLAMTGFILLRKQYRKQA
ncbi:processed acidic surface protein [Bacillus marasmi]|uniref:processed acidic surface protein n=1 Tax=Bacillus marasmi TaxID=1926279 RepID=UPI00164E5E20|nr:processed acidic surface protein [Bacillus marasmi]